LSTSDLVHIAVEERLIEQAIHDALQPKAASHTIRKRAYQARYEISRYDQNEFAETVIPLLFLLCETLSVDKSLSLARCSAMSCNTDQQ
jgi:hypothetical protein